jgi:hypothetical protein
MAFVRAIPTSNVVARTNTSGQLIEYVIQYIMEDDVYGTWPSEIRVRGALLRGLPGAHSEPLADDRRAALQTIFINRISVDYQLWMRLIAQGTVTAILSTPMQPVNKLSAVYSASIISAISLTPANAGTILQGGSAQFSASALNGAGTPIFPQPAQTAYAWSVIDATDGTITSGGLFTAAINAPTGAFGVQAAIDSFYAVAGGTIAPTVASVTITGPSTFASNSSSLYTVHSWTGAAGSGTELTGQLVTSISSSNISKATVPSATTASLTPFSFSVTGVASGSTVISAIVGNCTGTLSIGLTAAATPSEVTAWQAFATQSDFVAVFSPKQSSYRTVDGSGNVTQLRDLLGSSVTLDAIAGVAGTLDGSSNLVLPAGKYMETAVTGALDLEASLNGFFLMAVYKNLLGDYVIRTTLSDNSNSATAISIYGNGATGTGTHRMLAPSFTDTGLADSVGGAMRAVLVSMTAHTVGGAGNTSIEVFNSAPVGGGAIGSSQGNQKLVVGSSNSGAGGSLTLALVAVCRRYPTFADWQALNDIATSEHGVSIIAADDITQLGRDMQASPGGLSAPAIAGVDIRSGITLASGKVSAMAGVRESGLLSLAQPTVGLQPSPENASDPYGSVVLPGGATGAKYLQSGAEYSAFEIANGGFTVAWVGEITETNAGRVAFDMAYQGSPSAHLAIVTLDVAGTKHIALSDGTNVTDTGVAVGAGIKTIIIRKVQGAAPTVEVMNSGQGRKTAASAGNEWFSGIAVDATVGTLHDGTNGAASRFKAFRAWRGLSTSTEDGIIATWATNNHSAA